MPLFSCIAPDLYLTAELASVSQHQALIDPPLAPAAQGPTMVWTAAEPRGPERHKMRGSGTAWASVHRNNTWVLLLEMGKMRHGRSRRCAHTGQHQKPLLLSPSTVLPRGTFSPSSLFNLVSLFLKKKKKNLFEHKMGFIQQKCLLFPWRPTDWSHQAVHWSAAGHGEAGQQGCAHGEEHGQSMPRQRGDLAYWIIPGLSLLNPVFSIPSSLMEFVRANLTSRFPFHIFFLCWRFNSSPWRAGVVPTAVLTYSLPAAAAPAPRWPPHRCTATLLGMVLGLASSAVP